MKVLITGICGFAGYQIATQWLRSDSTVEIVGMDNLIRSGSETNRASLRKMGIRFFHGDIRNASDFEALPKVDWVIDCAANPSVLAGLDGKSSSRQLMEHNLAGTIEILEFCRRSKAGLILLSTSRVYSVEPLASLPVKVSGKRFVLDDTVSSVPGITVRGIGEEFPALPPQSLYGASKRAAEILALEYGNAFDFPVWINRCGVMAGAGQFGKIDQGIVSFWIHSHRTKQLLHYIGFGGNGYQVRDFFHPNDLIPLFAKQTSCTDKSVSRIVNLGGGETNSLSLAELTEWCDNRFGKHEVMASPEIRPFDIPWVVMDASEAERRWGWKPETTRDTILEEIAQHSERNPEWLGLTR